MYTYIYIYIYIHVYIYDYYHYVISNTNISLFSILSIITDMLLLYIHNYLIISL